MTSPDRAPPAFDLLGFVLAGGGLATVLYALTEAPDRGWGSGDVLVPLVGGGVLLGVTVPWELRAGHPVIDLRVMEDHLFRTTQLVLLPTGAAFMGVLYLYPQFLQTGLGYDALRSGLATFPEALGMLTASQVVPRLDERIGPRRLMAAGATGAALLMALMATLSHGTAPLVLRASMYLLGCCVGMVFMSGQNAAFVTVPPARTADATTVLSMQRQTAGAFGVALAGTLSAGLGDSAGAVGTSAYRVGFRTLAALSLGAALLALRIATTGCGTPTGPRATAHPARWSAEAAERRAPRPRPRHVPSPRPPDASSLSRPIQGLKVRIQAHQPKSPSATMAGPPHRPRRTNRRTPLIGASARIEPRKRPVFPDFLRSVSGGPYARRHGGGRTARRTAR
ncbi:MFS transporter [Streptomyces sp. NPDC048275]|uniref:MFS transporter n=1 Tax=Streptomyces sp. NPDC048275 TaxID=3155629 RepID=UPI0033DD7604